MNPNYCVRCAELHIEGLQTCPQNRAFWAQYTVSKSWSTDLKATDLPEKGGYPADLGHQLERKPSHLYLDFDNGEPNPHIRPMSLIFNVSKGGGSGGATPIDRETSSIRANDARRLVDMYSYLKGKRETGIPTLDRKE